jgi:putative DNA primase/helicase
MRISEFLALPKIHESLRKAGDQRWQCLCPAHADHRTKSLCIGVGDDGRILVDCKAGCKVDDVCKSLDIKLSDLFPDAKDGVSKRRLPKETKVSRSYPSIEDAGRKIAKRIQVQDSRPVRLVKSWAYHNADGTESFVVLRFDYTDGNPDEKPDKTFRPIHREGAGYVEGDPPGLLPLYGLTTLDGNALVTIHEGEKSADAARSIGLCATTSAHGSKSPDKTDFGPLAGRDVMILPDNDPPGRKYGTKVRDILLGLKPRARVRIVMLPGLPEHGDIYDWIEQHDATEPEALRAQILALADKAKPEQKATPESTAPRPVYVWMKDVAAKPVQWLWRDRVPSAMLSLLIGIEGKGKTFVALDMAARVTTGRLWPDSETAGDAPLVGNAVFLTSEDHLEYTIRPRLDAARADPARIVALKGVTSPKGDEFFDVMQHLPALEILIQEASPVQLVIVDPLTAFLGTTDQHKNGEVRMALARFSALAEKYGCAVVGISHLSKDASKQAIHRTIGSVAFSAAARAVWLVSEDKQDSERRLFVPVKMNLARMARSLAFRIENMAVAWEDGQFDYAADEVLAVDANREEGTAMNDACQWLQSTLADGRVRSAEVFTMGKQESFSERTLQRAKKKLGVLSEKEGIGNVAIWYWRLP